MTSLILSEMAVTYAACGRHHVMNKPRPSARISYCKRRTRRAWERGYVGSGGEFEGVRTNPLLGFKRFYTSPTYALPFVSSPLASLPLRIIAITALTPVQWQRVYLCNTKDVDLIVFLCMCMFLLCSSLFVPFPTWDYSMMID